MKRNTLMTLLWGAVFWTAIGLMHYAEASERHWLMPPKAPMYWVNMTLHAMDTYQTCQFRRRGLHEVNMEWIIGTEPTCHDASLAAVGGAILIHFTDRIVVRRWPRAGKALRYAFGVARFEVVRRNRRLK